MRNNTRKFEDLVNLYRNTKFNKTYTEGTIMISSDELCLCIKDILQDPDDFGITLESGTIEHGEEIAIHISPPKMRIGQLHISLNDYLKNRKNRIKEARDYYLLEEDYFNKDTQAPSLINSYRLLLRLIALFKECSAYLDEINCELVFVESNVVKIPVNYDQQTLERVEVDNIKNFIASFAQDTHRDQKLTILANSIKSMSETKTKDSSFSYLIVDFPQLCESFCKGYNVYVSGFSYDKIMDQLRVAKIEEMSKIHKIFSDIQNQILGIPVATLIVATQMKLAKGWDGQALINTAVILGALFFTAMILFVVFNQWQTLTAISDELEYKEKQAETKYKAIYDDIKTTFESLRTRITIQKIVFVALMAFVLTGIILALKFYFFFTPYAYAYIFK